MKNYKSESTLEQLLKIKTKAGVEKFIKELPVSWVNVGGKDISNMSIINIVSEPSSAVIELVTNAIDSNIQKEFLIKKEPKGLKNPRQASEKLFNIPGGRLSSFTNARDLNLLSELTQVFLHDSGNDKKPTLDVRDYGIGIAAKDFAHTILGLHKGNKNGKPHLMGLFGQGGTTALKFCEYRLIISRPYFEDKKLSNIVSFTIVRFNQSKIEGTMSAYEYCIDKNTQKPIEITVSNDEIFKHGTLVRQVEMNIGVFTGKITVPDDRSMWYLLHHNLFDTIMPISLYDTRVENVKYENTRFSKKAKSNQVRRTITGNNRLLTNRFKGQDKNEIDPGLPGVEYSNVQEMSCTFGKVKVFYWVLNTEKKSNPRVYASASSQIVFCHNGQKHHSLPRNFISKPYKENGAGLPYLDDNLIVQVELDSINFQTKEHLITSTRERLSNIQELKELEGNLAHLLNSDDELQRINVKKQRLFRTEGDVEIPKEISNRLSKLLNGKLPFVLEDSNVKVLLNKEGEDESNPSNSKNNIGDKKHEIIPTSENPTFFQFDFATKDIYPGRRFSLSYTTDASESILNFDCLNMEIVCKTNDYSNNSIKLNSILSNNDGYGKLLFSCNNDAEINSIVSFGISFKQFPNIGDMVELQVCESEIKKRDVTEGVEKSKSKQIKYQISPLHKDKHKNIFYNVFSDINKVSDFKSENDRIVIYINMSHPFLEKSLDGMESVKKNRELKDIVEKDYMTEISIQTILQYHNQYYSNSEGSKLNEITSEDKEIIFNTVMLSCARTLVIKLTSKDYIREKHYLKNVD